MIDKGRHMTLVLDGKYRHPRHAPTSTCVAMSTPLPGPTRLRRGVDEVATWA